MARAPRETAKRRPTNQEAAASKEIGWALDWNVSQMLTGLPQQLFGRQLLAEMYLMANTDETVGSMMWCICSTLAQVTWKHVPQLDGLDNDKDPESLRLAAFADGLLVDMRRSFAEHVDDAMTMVWAGFAPCEIILKQRTDGRFNDKLWGIDDISLRDPLSIWRWEYSEDRRTVIGARQQTYQGGASLPMWKLCNYRTSSAADLPMGRPLLLNAHRAWRLKNRIQDSEAIGIERELCGLPIFRVPESDIATANERDGDGAFTADAAAAQKRISQAIQTVQNIRLNKTGGLVLPSDTFAADDPETKDRTRKYDFDIITSAGQRSIDARSAVRDYDRAIARVVMMQFLHLGDRSNGSFGLSDDQSSMAIRSLMALAQKVATEFTRKALTLVWQVNAFDKRYMPRLAASDINKDGLQAIGAFLTGMAKADWMLAEDADARGSVLKLAGIGYDRDAQAKAAKTAGEAATLAAQPPPTPIMAPPGGAAPKPKPKPQSEN